MTKKKIYIAVFLLLVSVVAYSVFLRVKWHRIALIPVRQIQHFSFVNQDGETFLSESMQGKVCVIEYFFTTCKSICPKMNTNMKAVYKQFALCPNFLILSFTCDPHTDSIARLKAYADSLGVNTKKWLFLTGEKDSLYYQARANFLVDASQLEFLHTQFFALIDKHGRLRNHSYDGLKQQDVQQLVSDINLLLKEK